MDYLLEGIIIRHVDETGPASIRELDRLLANESPSYREMPAYSRDEMLGSILTSLMNRTEYPLKMFVDVTDFDVTFGF